MIALRASRYVPKGVWVLLFSDPALRRAAVYATADWPGYPVVSTTAQSTKSAGPLASAWAVLQTVGEAGYLELAGAALAATVRLREGIAAAWPAVGRRRAGVADRVHRGGGGAGRREPRRPRDR